MNEYEKRAYAYLKSLHLTAENYEATLTNSAIFHGKKEDEIFKNINQTQFDNLLDTVLKNESSGELENV